MNMPNVIHRNTRNIEKYVLLKDFPSNVNIKKYSVIVWKHCRIKILIPLFSRA